jgi:isopropylmalate/homocitrate/citramalate synthase
MKNLDALIEDLTESPDVLRDLASRVMGTNQGEWEALNQHLKSMGYEVDIQNLKNKVKEVAEEDEKKENELIQNWYQHV